MIHGPNSPDTPPSAVRKAAMEHHDSWYYADHWARDVTYIILAFIGVAALVYCLRLLRLWRPSVSSRLLSSPGYARIVALFRTLSYRQRVTSCLGLPPLGPTIMISAFFVALTCWAFGTLPYYRLTREWGSPPLAIRGGWIALAFTPFIFGLAGKFNFITLVTGLGHERLQIFHQYAARIALFFSVVHTLPFIIQPLRDAGPSNLYAYFYSSPQYWNGCVALAALVWLVFSSFARLRNVSYEFFVLQHIVSALFYLVFMFIHCDMELTSWNWLWSTVALYGAGVFARLCGQAFANDFFLSPTSCNAWIEATEEDEATRLVCVTPMRWSPGQHVFVRFPTISPLENHPFTIASLPSPDLNCAQNRIVVLARAHGGLTRKLFSRTRALATHVGRPEDEEAAIKAEACRSGTVVPAVVDGPYGGDASMVMYERVLLVAGGVGCTFIAPVLLDLARRMRKANGTRRGAAITRRVELVWAIKKSASVAWIEDFLLEAVSLAPVGTLCIHIYVTDDPKAATDGSESKSAPGPATSDDADGDGKEEAGGDAEEHDRRSSNRAPSAWTLHLGRPELPVVLEQCALAAGQEGALSLGVAVCGPRGMATNVADGVARLNARLVLRSKGGKLGSLKEVYLRSEEFGW